MTRKAGAEPQARMGASEESWNPALRKVNSSHFLHKKFTTCCHTILLLAFITPWRLIDSFLAALKQGCILQGNRSTAGAVGSCSIISRTLKAESKLNTQIVTNYFPSLDKPTGWSPVHSCLRFWEGGWALFILSLPCSLETCRAETVTMGCISC